MTEQAKSVGCEILYKKVLNVIKTAKWFNVFTYDDEFSSKSIIIALGTEKRKLNIAGEDKFIGRGVSYCATCDAAFFKEMDVGVIGGCDSAAHTALLLAKIAKKVYVIYRKSELRCQVKLYKQMQVNKKIEIINDSVPLEITGNGKVSGLVYDQGGKKQKLKIDGVFIEAGSVPSGYLVDKLKIQKDKQGFVIVNDKMETNVRGVFSSGDINSDSIKQALIAAASGATAAISANNYLKEN